MSAVDGQWSLIDVSNFAAYCEKVGFAEEYKEKLRRLAEAVKSDPSVYIEELHINKDTQTIRRTVLIKGEVKKESGDVKIGVEHDAHAADGRPAKIKLVYDAEKKQLIRHENGQGYSSTTTYALEGDHLVVTSKCGDVASVMKFKRA